MAEFLYRLGRGAARRARTVIALWVAILLAAGAAFALFSGELKETLSIPGTPTSEVSDRLTEEFSGLGGGTGTVVFQTEDGAAFTDEQRSAITERIAQVADLPGVEDAVDPFATEEARAEQQQQVSEGRTGIDEGREELQQGQEELDEARAQAEAAGMLDQVAPQLDAQQAEIDEGLATLEEQSAQLEEGEALLDMAADIRMVSEDGSAALSNIAFTEPQQDVPQETKDAVMAVFEDDPVEGVTVDFGSDIAMAVPDLLGIGEVVGLVVAAVVLVIMLGTLVGAGLPILTALIGVGVGALAGLSLSDVVEMASVTPILGVMLGLAVGIDYSLFIINRHRIQLKQGRDVKESIGLANGTAGNAVVFAGATVLIALLGLNLTGIGFLGVMGTVGALSILVAVLIAVTLTPALLSLAGPRILSRRERARLAEGPAVASQEGDGDAAVRPMRTGAAVGRALLGIAVLVVVAIPALDLRLGLPDGSSEPHDSTQYRAYSIVSEEFGAGQNGTLLVAADLPGSPTQEEAAAYQLQLAEELYGQDSVVAVAPIAISDDRDLATFQVVPEDGPTSESTEELVHTLRDLAPLEGAGTLGVAGTASGNIDISDKLSDALPTYLAVVVGFSLVILLLVFRSIFVPVVATLGFILSYFAALGGVVAIYQWGWLAGLFGVDSPGPILNFLPTILVGILFGLAMDYMLFLGTGMREAYVHGAPARTAVVQGVRAGRAVVTAAAIIMISVFGGFVFSHSAMIRPVGFALAFGVLLDAFLVRMMLIPALMHLVGEKAWWLPRWLDRILPNVDVEGSALERRHSSAPASTDTGESGLVNAASGTSGREGSASEG
ncbi:MMPL family transporter [Marinactinospora thermotolerans]|uniref:Putative drug exporter of the RND superfamily n=1 Tax=Marinactinospora thermotolerans DSM 45154 TaxID=1122192 RepID=A0A1T4NHB3_9ACTN|nr:MMPL family transporter [Marinactinospora thermotolerans]SJZ78437.1 putative drug exporter of the RND superfamily [Marinactinospora thermotolerans DSM 45154]